MFIFKQSFDVRRMCRAKFVIGDRTKVRFLETGENTLIWLKNIPVVCSYKKMAAWVNGKVKVLFYFFLMVHWVC